MRKVCPNRKPLVSTEILWLSFCFLLEFELGLIYIFKFKITTECIASGLKGVKRLNWIRTNLYIHKSIYPPTHPLADKLE